MTNEQLVYRIKAGEDVAGNMAQLYEQTKDFINSLARKYRDSGEQEDLEQEGYLALYAAIDGYDPAAGVKFLTYAAYHIRQRMRRYLQLNGSCLHLPVHCIEKLQKYNRFCDSFIKEHGRNPSESETAACLGMSIEQVQNIKNNACISRLESLDAPVCGVDEEIGGTMGDFIAAPCCLEDDVLETVDNEQLSSVLWECVDALPEQQSQVLRARYEGGKTLKDTGSEVGIDLHRVRTVENNALRNLRCSHKAPVLWSFLTDASRIFSMGISGTGAGRFQTTWTSATERTVLTLIGEREPAHNITE